MTEEPTEPQVRRSKRDIALRIIFGALFIVGLVTGYVLKPSLNAEMRQFLKGSYVETIEETEPAVAIPFLPWQGRMLTVWHQFQVDEREEPFRLQSYFTRDGDYRATHTVSLPALARRRPAAELEHLMSRNGERYHPPSQTMQAMDFSNIMANLAEHVDVTRVSGFIIFPVSYVENDAHSDVSTVPAVVMHLWCTTDRSEGDINDEQRKPCPAAARIVYNLDAQHLVLHDELL